MEQTAQVNKFLPIIDTWESYYDDPREGMGTVYERFILQRIFMELPGLENIMRVLEVPSFGMTGLSGINSLWWAQQGRDVSVVDWNLKRLNYIRQSWDSLGFPLNSIYWNKNTNLPFSDNSFDLSWNFASLWFLKDVTDFAQELKRLTQHIILICVPNLSGVGVKLRKKYADHMDGLYPENARPELVIKNFSGEGWKLYADGIFDVPPWPDIPVKKEVILQKLRLSFLQKWLDGHQETVESPNAEIIDYFTGDDPDLENRILKYNFFENAPKIFKQFWGHHRYFVFTREDK